jgi:electron transport complex protein RnfG
MTDSSKDISSQSEQSKPDQSSSLSMIITLGGVAMLSGLLVVLTWQLTLAPIMENQRIMIEQAIFQVIPAAQQRRSYIITDEGIEDVSALQKNQKKKKLKKAGIKFYAAYDEQGQLKGIAAQAAAQGYADMVRLLYGYDPQCECIRGFSIIKMTETPGLGDKILTDQTFLASFDALDARLSDDKKSLKNPIITVKHGSKKNLWEIDAISGATITSKAVGKAINQGAAQLLPQLAPYIDQLQKMPAITDETTAKTQVVKD